MGCRRQKGRQGAPAESSDAVIVCVSPKPACSVWAHRTPSRRGEDDEVLRRLADFLQAQTRMKNRVSAAMTYPLIMMIMGGAVVSFLLAFVVPKIVKVVLKKGNVLPLPTKMLITIQDLFLRYWWLGLLLMVVSWVVRTANFRCPKISKFWKILGNSRIVSAALQIQMWDAVHLPSSLQDT